MPSRTWSHCIHKQWYNQHKTTLYNSVFLIGRLPSCLYNYAFISQKSAAEFRERISDKYSRIHVVLNGDERLMMQIIDAEEANMTEWLEAQRAIVEAQIKEIDTFRASSKSLLQETNDLRFLQVGLHDVTVSL